MLLAIDTVGGQTQRSNADRWADQGAVQPVDRLKSRSDSLRQTLDAGAVQTELQRQARETIDRQRVNGVSLLASDAEARLLTALENQFDTELAANVQRLQNDVLATEREARTRLEASRRPPAKQDDGHELALYRRHEGRTLADLAETYAATADADDPVLVRIIETAFAKNQLDVLFKVRRAERTIEDVAAAMALTSAIRARQTAREDQGARATLDQMADLRTRYTLTETFERARLGRLEVARQRRRDVRRTA